MSRLPLPSPLLLLLLLLTAGSVLCSPTAEAQAALVEEEWFQIRLQSEPIGTAHRSVHKQRHGSQTLYLTKLVQTMRFKRLGTEIESTTRTIVTETEEGTVLDFERVQQEGTRPNSTRGYREGEEMIVMTQGITRRVPMPSKALGPYAVERRLRVIDRTAGTLAEVLTFTPESPQRPVFLRAKVLGLEVKQVAQRPRSLWRISTTLDSLPGLEIDSWIDAEGRSQLVTLPFGGLGQIEMVATTASEAKQPIIAREAMALSLIKPSQPIPRHRELRTARYFITGATPLNLPKGREQEVVRDDAVGTEVVIRQPPYRAEAIAVRIPLPPTPTLEPFSRATPFLEIKHPRVRTLAFEAVGTEQNPMLAARRIEQFVQRHITTKNLSSSFASAAEVAENKSGDCTEHAVLAAAMARVMGLPSRLVVGLAYQPNDTTALGSDPNDPGTFGYHMWVETYLGGDDWLPIDPALGRFTVTHIALLKTSLDAATPTAEVFFPIMQRIGKLKIDVLSFE